MKYESKIEKIRKLWKQKRDISKRAGKINGEAVRFGSINYHWKFREYSTEWYDVNKLGNNFSFTINLYNFPEREISFLKFLPVYKSLSGIFKEVPGWGGYVWNVSITNQYIKTIISKISSKSYQILGRIKGNLLDGDNNTLPLYFKLFVILTNEESYNEIRFHKS